MEGQDDDHYQKIYDDMLPALVKLEKELIILIDPLSKYFTILPLDPFMRGSLIVEYTCEDPNTFGRARILPPNENGKISISCGINRHNGDFIKNLELQDFNQVIEVIQFMQGLLIHQPPGYELEKIQVPDYMRHFWFLPDNY